MEDYVMFDIYVKGQFLVRTNSVDGKQLPFKSDELNTYLAQKQRVPLGGKTDEDTDEEDGNRDTEVLKDEVSALLNELEFQIHLNCNCYCRDGPDKPLLERLKEQINQYMEQSCSYDCLSMMVSDLQDFRDPTFPLNLLNEAEEKTDDDY